MLSYRSRCTLMSLSDHSVQCCFRSNTPQGFSCIENYEAAASAKFCAASGCEKTQAGSQCKHHWTASIRDFSSYLQKYWYFLISLLDIYLNRIIISIQYPLIYAIWWAITEITWSPLYEWMKKTRGFIYHTHKVKRVWHSQWLQRLPSH